MAQYLNVHIFVAAPIIAWAISQVIKTFFYLVSEKQVNVARLFDTGGMPSSHCAAVMALVTVLAYKTGMTNPLFAVALIFGAIVVYDATNLRRAAGDQAQLLNRVIPDLLSGKFVKQFDYKALREMLGHSWQEALVGCGVGFLIAFAMVMGLR
jgi:acid phosphatase family membrane protein YuiD